MAQQLPHQLVGAWVAVEFDFGRQVAELVRGDFHPQMPQNGPLDSDLDRSLGSRLAVKGDKHRIGTLADHRGGNLVAINLKALGEHRRNLELEWVIVLGFVAPECEECRLAASLRPVQMLVEVSRRISSACAAAKWRRRSIARALCRSMNGRFEVARSAPRCAPQLVRKVDQSREQARVIELAQQRLVLFGQAGRQRSELAPKGLEGRDYIRGRLHPFRGNRDQRDGNAVGVGGQLASVLAPEMTHQGAEGFGFNKARQRGDLIERDPGRNRRARGRMDVSLLQAQAQRCERPCPGPFSERVRHRRPREVYLTSSRNEAGSCCQGIRVGAARLGGTATGRSPAP